MLKVAAQCCARGRGRSLLHEQGSRDEQPTSPAADAGNLTRAEIELGHDHPVVIQLLTMSLGIRLCIVRRETEQSALRGTNQCAAEGVEDKTFGRCGGTAGGAPSNPTTATTIQELAEREENLDPVRYSPSLRRGRLIRDLVRDADRAEKIVTASLSESKTGLTGCGRVYADALVAHSMAFSVAGAHWALSAFVRGYSTVDSVAASLVSNAINSASTTALQRLTARHHRYTVRKLWDDENHRLHSLDETFLRKERARLRQDYRRHKKRGRPGRIKMKEAKQQLDLLQMDLDHTLGKAWHPNHAIRPPSLQTPRVGPKVVKEELPPGWYKVKKGPTMEGFCSEDCPYYFHEATGETSWTKPTFQFDGVKRIRDSVSVTNEQLAIKSHSGECEVLLQEEEGKTGKSNGSDDKTGQTSSGRTGVDEFSMRNEEGKTGDFLCETEKLNCIKPEDIEEQHRKYFSEALDTARRSCALLDEMRSPRRYKGEAAMAFVCFTAANVADSEGNAATGLEISGTDLINMAVDHMAASREFAVRAGLRWTLGYAKLCRQSANISFYRMKDGDVSDGAEFLNEAQLVYKSLGLDQDDWHVIETKERQDALVLFEGYAN
jgi:hypothetical protein